MELFDDVKYFIMIYDDYNIMKLDRYLISHWQKI